MGVGGLWKLHRKDANWSSNLNRVHIDMTGKKVGYELAGRGFQAVMKVAKDAGRAEAIAKHCSAGKPWTDPGVAVLIATAIVKDITKIASAVGTLFVVPEASFSGKRHCSQRRGAKCKKAIEDKQYSKGVALPDCVNKLVAIEVGKLPNATFVTTVVGEGEAQLMFMLKRGDVDFVLNYSGDVDTSVYESAVGTIVNCPQTMGSINGRRYHGVQGVSVWGKKVECAELFKGLAVGGWENDDTDTSRFKQHDRALLAGILGHDYDSEGTGTRGRGLVKVGPVKTIPAINVSIDEMPDATPLARVQHVCELLNRKDDIDRMMAVVVGFCYHSVVDVHTGHACTYSVPTPSCKQWIKKHEPAFWTVLTKLNLKKKIKSMWESHRGCKDCNVNGQSLTDANAQKVAAMVGPIKQHLKPVAGAECLPGLDYEELRRYLTVATKCDPRKAIQEGMTRAYDNAGNEDSGSIYTDRSATPPVCYLTRNEIQSQNRDPYTVIAKVELNTNMDTVEKVVTVLCTCYRECAGVVCHHRTSVLCYLFLNTMLGLAGNRTARIKYWAGFAGDAKPDLAVRLAKLITNRTGQVSLEDVDSMAADDSAPESDSEAVAGEKKKKAKTSKRKRRDMDAYANSCTETCAKYYRLDIEALGKLAREGGIQRMSKWGIEDCSFLEGVEE